MLYTVLVQIIYLVLCGFERSCREVPLVNYMNLIFIFSVLVTNRTLECLIKCLCVHNVTSYVLVSVQDIVTV